MTELEKMERAQLYLKKMTEGINPITDEYADENDTINNVRVSRCLFYISEILQKVIDNGGEVVRVEPIRRHGDFFITDEQRARLSALGRPVTSKVITDRINEITDENGCKKFAARWVSEYFVSIGLLIQMEGIKVVSESGKDFGISTEEKVTQYGKPYTAIMYSPDAQQFIIDNIDAIIDFARSEQYKEQTKRNKD